MSETLKKGNGEESWLEIVRQQADSLCFGVVEVVVPDSQVTQIDKTERVRLDKPSALKPFGLAGKPEPKTNECQPGSRSKNKSKHQLT